MVGQLLREAREAKGYTLEEAERATRIRAKYLAAFEAEEFSALPSAAQARGFLRNYAQFLGLEADAILAEYARLSKKPGLSLGLPSAPPQRPAASAGGIQVRPRRRLTADVLVAAILSLALGLLLLWGGSQVFSGLADAETTPTAAAASATPALTAAATSPAVIEDVVPTQPLPTPLPDYTGVHVLVRAEQRLWLRVTVDGVENFSGLLRPGESQEFVGQRVVELATGNGKGTRVIWNGVDQGTLGGLGEVVVRLWTLDGMITPTPTSTPPPTRTPRP